MLLPAVWEGSKDSFKELGKGFFCFVLKHLQIGLLEQKHSRLPLLTKQPDTEYAELCLQTQWALHHFLMYLAVEFSRFFPDLAQCS